MKEANQIKETGARTIIASCDNCHIQLSDLSEHYGLNVQVTGLAELVVNALDKEKASSIDSSDKVFQRR
jgi:Fe-S oxidoreductase